MCGKRCGVLWLLPAALFLAFCCLSSAGAQVTLTEEEFTTLSENLTQLETLNEEQAKSLEEREIQLQKLRAQLTILDTLTTSLTASLNATATQLQRADASLTRAETYLSEQDAAHKRRTFLTGAISVFVGGFVGLVSGVVWG